MRPTKEQHQRNLEKGIGFCEREIEHYKQVLQSGQTNNPDYQYEQIRRYEREKREAQEELPKTYVDGS